MTEKTDDNNKTGADDLRQQIKQLSDHMTAELAKPVINNALFQTLTRERNALTKRLDRLTSQPGAVAVAEAESGIKQALRAWLAKRDYRYVLATDRFWLSREDGSWLAIKDEALKKERTTLKDSSEWSCFMDIMHEDKRWYDDQTYSFRKVSDHTLNMMRTKFIDPTEGEAHWLFDTVVRSIAGDKAENIEHIEKLIVAKYLHPENILLPALVLQDSGGTGKSLFVSRVLKAIFGKTGVADNLSIEALLESSITDLKERRFGSSMRLLADDIVWTI